MSGTLPPMRAQVLRSRGSDEVSVTNMELFFDLVYVFAITQLSQFLFAHLSPRGGLETAVLFSAVWWAWNYTAWATNWIDPARRPVAALLLVMMAVGLVMSAALPDAFAHRGPAFAIAYVVVQLLRTGFVAGAFPSGHRMRSNNLRLLAWLAIGGVPWLVGAFLHGDARLVVWLIAVAVDNLAPLHGFWLPGIGRTPIEAWELSGGHLAERCQLVLIIALGESVLRVGETFADRPSSAAVDVAFVVGFLVSVALWAAYFLCHAERGARSVAGAGSAARIGRSGYAYAHSVMVAGVIVVAVAIRATIDQPDAAVGVTTCALTLGGPVLYLIGLALFERAATLGGSPQTLCTVALLGLLTLAAVIGADRLVLAVCVAVVLVGLTVSATRRGREEVPPAGSAS